MWICRVRIYCCVCSLSCLLTFLPFLLAKTNPNRSDRLRHWRTHHAELFHFANCQQTLLRSRPAFKFHQFWHTKFFITPRVSVDEAEMRCAVEKGECVLRLGARWASSLMPLGAAQEKLWLFYGPKKVEWRVQGRNCI